MSALEDVAKLIESGIQLPKGVAFTQLPDAKITSLDTLLSEAFGDFNPLTSVYQQPDIYSGYLDRWRFWSGEIIAYLAREAEIYRDLAAAEGKTYGESVQIDNRTVRASVVGKNDLRSIYWQLSSPTRTERLNIVMNGDQVADRPDAPAIHSSFTDENAGGNIFKLTFLGDRINTFRIQKDGPNPKSNQNVPLDFTFNFSTQAREELESNVSK